jgi:hypothetical protein
MNMIDLPLNQLPNPLSEVLEIWKRLDGERLGCRWERFDLSKLPPKLIPSTMVIDVGNTMDDNQYRFWGSRMTSIRGVDLTGENPYQIADKSNADRLRIEHGKTIKDGIARASVVELPLKSGIKHNYYSLRLPLSDDSINVHHLVILIDLNSPDPDFVLRALPSRK